MSATLLRFPAKGKIMGRKSRPLENPPNRLREHRERLGLTLAEAVLRLKVTEGHLQKWETGERNITVEQLRRVARAYGLNIGDLLNSDDNPASLTEDERFLLDSAREDPSLAANMMALAEVRTRFTPAPRILPFPKSA